MDNRYHRHTHSGDIREHLLSSGCSFSLDYKQQGRQAVRSVAFSRVPSAARNHSPPPAHHVRSLSDDTPKLDIQRHMYIIQREHMYSSRCRMLTMFPSTPRITPYAEGTLRTTPNQLAFWHGFFCAWNQFLLRNNLLRTLHEVMLYWDTYDE